MRGYEIRFSTIYVAILTGQPCKCRDKGRAVDVPGTRTPLTRFRAVTAFRVPDDGADISTGLPGGVNARDPQVTVLRNQGAI